MINVGVIGLGMMGSTHLDAYAKRGDVRVVAVSDRNLDRLHGRVKAQGNVEGQAQGAFDLSTVRKYEDGLKLIADPEIQVIDICAPTIRHVELTKAALAAGKHVLVEKPLARTAAEAFDLVRFAEQHPSIAMPAMCVRFWPGWSWLKEAVEKQTYGKVLSAHFRRVASHPGGKYYSDGGLSGGAILDLHIHDTDFVQFLFGVPRSVTSFGYSSVTSEIDHVVTRYECDGAGPADKSAGPPLVIAEGSWSMAPGFAFHSQYTINFERATADYDMSRAQPLLLCENGEREPLEFGSEMGYDLEIDYFLQCVARNQPPRVVTLRDAAAAVAIVEAERQSILSGGAVAVRL